MGLLLGVCQQGVWHMCDPAERRAQSGGDYSPLWWPNVLSFRSAHPGGAHFAFGDDRVVFVADAIDPTVYHALATIAGGESLA